MCKSECKGARSAPMAATPAMTQTLQRELNAQGVLISNQAAEALVAKVLAADRACPNADHMAEHACSDKSQCWEPCGQLGHDPAHARVSRVQAVPFVREASAGPAQ